jgi:hypothetical protein
MKFSLRTYAAYSIGCLFVWAVLLAVVESTGSTSKRHTVLLVFLGWAIGWVSATIARAVYPPFRSKMRAQRIGLSRHTFRCCTLSVVTTTPPRIPGRAMREHGSGTPVSRKKLNGRLRSHTPAAVATARQLQERVAMSHSPEGLGGRHAGGAQCRPNLGTEDLFNLAESRSRGGAQRRR